MHLKYGFPPTMNSDGSLTIKSLDDRGRAPAPNGFEYDSQSGTYVPLWDPCFSREMKIWPKECGSPGVTMYCRCEGCPMRGRIVKLYDCEDCTHRKSHS
jgi:hypothetical protein